MAVTILIPREASILRIRDVDFSIVFPDSPSDTPRQSDDLSFLDIGPFISALSSGSNDLRFDFNGDGVVDFLDIGPFIDALSASANRALRLGDLIELYNELDNFRDGIDLSLVADPDASDMLVSCVSFVDLVLAWDGDRSLAEQAWREATQSGSLPASPSPSSPLPTLSFVELMDALVEANPGLDVDRNQFVGRSITAMAWIGFVNEEFPPLIQSAADVWNSVGSVDVDRPLNELVALYNGLLSINAIAPTSNTVGITQVSWFVQVLQVGGGNLNVASSAWSLHETGHR